MMRIPRSALVLCLLASAPLPAATRADDAAKQIAALTAGRVAGEATNCIPQYRTNTSTTIYGAGVVYEVGGTRYLMRFRDGCDQLTENTLFSTDTPTIQLCAGDIARVYQQGAPNIFLGSCIIGNFVPYKRQG